MPRKPAPEAKIIDPATPESTASWSDSANALATLNAQANEAAQAVALQVGYDGTLAVGALEDEIRFYQRQTVQACLELGKRLLVLKALTPHGEFQSRLDFLGFTQQTSHRFMSAVTKTTKSPNLGYLSTQVKSMSAFLELVTHDEDTLEAIGQMDDIDRMSASELRNVARSLRGDLDAKDKVLDDTQKKLTRLQVESKKKIAADTDWPDALQPLAEQVAAAGRKLATALSEFETCRIRAFEVGSTIPEEDDPQRAKFEAALAHVAGVQANALNDAQRTLAKEQLAFEQTLGNFLPE